MPGSIAAGPPGLPRERDRAPEPGEGGARAARRPAEAPSGRRVDLPGYSDRFARLIGAGEAGDWHPERPPLAVLSPGRDLCRGA